MKYPAYKEYKESGVEWLGKIPTGWKSIRLKFITLQIIDGSHVTPTYVEDGIPFLRVTDIHKRKIDFTNVNKISYDEHKKLNKRFEPTKGDLLLSKNGTIGVPKVVNWEEPFSFFVSLAALRPSKKINVKFLEYIFWSKHIDEQINAGGKKNTITNLHLDRIKEFYLALPNLSTQTAIANFLDRETRRIDALIAKKQRLIEILKEKRTALITHAVTKGLNPDAPTKDSGIDWLGEIPEHWEVWKVSHGYKTFGSGTTPKSDNFDYYEEGEVPWITTSELRENYIRQPRNKITHEALRDYPSLKKYPPGTLLIAMYGATIGRLGMLDIDATVNQACFAFANSRIFSNRFVFYWLQIARPILISESFGGGQPNLNQDFLRKLKIPIPEMEEQNEIANYLDKETGFIDNVIRSTQQSITKQQEYRTALISAAVTGKIDVREAVGEHAT